MELIWVLLLSLTGNTLANPAPGYGFCSNRNNKCLKAVSACPSAAQECRACLQITTTIRPTSTLTKTVRTTRTVEKTVSELSTSTQEVKASISTTITPSPIIVTETATVTQDTIASSPNPEKRDFPPRCNAQKYGSCKMGEYQSACSCLGIMPSTKTVVSGPAETKTKTVTSIFTSKKTTTIISTSLLTTIVETSTISTTLDPSTTTTTITTTVAPPQPTVAQGCQGIFLYDPENNLGQAGQVGLTLGSRFDGFDIVNSRLQPRTTIVRFATGRQGTYTPVFLETAEQQQSSGNQALVCSFVGSSRVPDLLCQLNGLDTFYQCPTISPDALVLSTPENVAADPALMADCTLKPLRGDCNK